MAKPKRDRTARREAARAAVRDAKDREKLFLREPGGSAERAIVLESPSVVEPRARSVPCPLCGGEQEVVEHAAVSTDQGTLREARLKCRRCGSRRSLWFRVALPN
ncbi:MAG TPA: hypothetical protein VHE30_22975 [Polyangiaceae bacterium]|nr:hypothetical protein [Polyangiaceae bacterium]